MSFYAELATTTNFSFLRGASHAQDMVLAALLLGHKGIGIADRNSVAGVVRAFGALEDLRKGVKLVDKVREGSGPGEYVLVDRHPDLDFPFTLADLQARAKNFKLAVGARLPAGSGGVGQAVPAFDARQPQGEKGRVHPCACRSGFRRVGAEPDRDAW